MKVREAVESDAETLASFADRPPASMRQLVHDRTVYVATAAEDESPNEVSAPIAYVAFDVHDGTVHVTGFGGRPEASKRLFEEPIRFASREGMAVELVVPETAGEQRETVEAIGFESVGSGPRFEGQPTTRYRLDPDGPVG